MLVSTTNRVSLFTGVDHWTGLQNAGTKVQPKLCICVLAHQRNTCDLVPFPSAMAEFNVFCHEVRALSIRTFVCEYDLNTNLLWRPYVGLH